jgi:hypothetical protein
MMPPIHARAFSNAQFTEWHANCTFWSNNRDRTGPRTRAARSYLIAERCTIHVLTTQHTINSIYKE